MSVYRSTSKVEDHRFSGADVGAYSFFIEDVQKSMSEKVGEYINVKFKCRQIEGEAFTDAYKSFFPNSEKDFPLQDLDRFLTVMGFYQNGQIEINDWSELVKRQGIVILQKEEEYNRKKNKVTAFLKPHSFYDLNNLSAGEITSGEKESKRFSESLEYVMNNPIKELKGDNKPKSSPQSNTSEPF